MVGDGIKTVGCMIGVLVATTRVGGTNCHGVGANVLKDVAGTSFVTVAVGVDVSVKSAPIGVNVASGVLV